MALVRVGTLTDLVNHTADIQRLYPVSGGAASCRARLASLTDDELNQLSRAIDATLLCARQLKHELVEVQS
jgi:hypothetical protein